MKDIPISLGELIKKVKTIRRDVQDLEGLRKMTSFEQGATFLVEKRIYVWMSGDWTQDDGKTSIRPHVISPAFRGRFRRMAPTIP